MLALEQMKPTSAGTVYFNQLNGQGQINIPADLTPEGVFITEIRPNDINRDADFGSGDNDVMECLELTNTTDHDINLNDEYQLIYVIKEGSRKANPLYKTDEVSTYCIIPAGGTAVIWCDRQNLLVQGTDYTRWPTETEFRSAYDIPDSTPIFVMTNQSGLNNTARGFELYKVNADSTTKLVSYYFWDGVDDLKDNRSVDLKVSADGPKMSVYAAQAVSNLGVVNAEQITYKADDGSSPTLTLLDSSTTVEQGDFLRIPYSFAGTAILPVNSFELYYKTSAMTDYVQDKATTAVTYNKYYAFIPSDVLLNADYVDYYLKAKNTYRNTMTEIRRIYVDKIDNTTGLRVNLNVKTAGDTTGTDMQTVSGKLNITAKNFDDTDLPAAMTLDGNALETSVSLEKCAYYTFSYTGVDNYFKNALTCGDKIIKLFARCNEIPAESSMAVRVNSSYFTYNADGTASIELVVRPGTYGSTWESETAANNDDFTIRNISLSLTDGTVISPTSFTDEDGNVLDPAATIKMGDSRPKVMAKAKSQLGTGYWQL